MITIVLNDLLKRKGISKCELHNNTGISVSFISALCNNETDGTYISFDVLETLCSKLECTPNDILKIDYERKGEGVQNNTMIKEVIDILVPEEILNMSIGDMIKDLNSEVICNDKVLTLATVINDKKVTLLIRKRNKEE